MPFAEINGAHLYYQDIGAGMPIVFVHAGIADSRMWDTQVAAFKTQYRVIRLDLRGYGQSAPTDGLYSHREDVLALMDRLEIDQAVLVGCSMSGKMAIDLALEQPQRVAALVVVAARPNGFSADAPLSPLVSDLAAAEAAGDLDLLNELEILYWVAGQGRTRAKVDPIVWALAIDMNRIALENEGHGDEKPPVEPPAIDRLHELSVPTLIVCGECDVPTMILAAAAMEQGIPSARKIMLTNAGHLPNMERPDEFNRAVKAFLNEVL